jgi:hypothetical protein
LKKILQYLLPDLGAQVPQDPMGVKGKTPIAFGGGEVLGSGFDAGPNSGVFGGFRGDFVGISWGCDGI